MICLQTKFMWYFQVRCSSRYTPRNLVTLLRIRGWSGKMWSWQDSLQCFKYDRVDFCLNSKSTPCSITEMNYSKILCIQQISSYTWWEKGHTVKSYKKKLINHKIILSSSWKMRNYAKTYFTSISYPWSSEHFSKTLGKIHVFISQTVKNHPIKGTRHAEKMVISSFQEDSQPVA